MSSEMILNSYLLIFFVYIIFEAVLIILNNKECQSTHDQVPAFLEGQIEEETFKKSVAYTLSKGKFNLFSHFFSGVVLFILVFSGWIGSWCNLWNEWLPCCPKTAAVLYLISLGVILDIISWPLQLYATFKIEAVFGFNRMSLALWISDKIKGYIVSLILGAAILYAILWFVDLSGAYWWIYASAFTIIFNLLLVYIYPVWIAPLFNKFKPLENESLKEKIFDFAKRNDFKLAEIFEMDGSKRTAHANAYFTGFGNNRRVVLFDTLCELLQESEIVAVLAHEIGHMKSKHIIKNMVISCVIMVFIFWLMDFILSYDVIFEAFGFAKSSIIAALALVLFAAGPITYFLSPLSSILSRRFEYQADEFAAKTCGGPEELSHALIALSKKSLSNYLPHPVFSFFHYSHPPLRERLAALSKYKIEA